LAKGGVVTVDLAGKSKKSKQIPLVSESGEFTFSFDPVSKKQ